MRCRGCVVVLGPRSYEKRRGDRHHAPDDPRGTDLPGRRDVLINPSEPIFVPRSGAVNEDDGYLLSIWWNRQTEPSELCICDTADFGRTPLARVKLPGRI
ncbi:MAG: carotenoid oxygenase family protein, partial [Mycobacteriaceae bacterium]